ncbi:MAG: hypothetical protein ACTSYB_10900 [Candidatus Helarchaeota archaeon]
MGSHKREYESDIAIVFFMGIAFIIFAAISQIPIFMSWIGWGIWMLFPGVIMIFISIGLFYQNRQLQRKVLRAITSGDYGGRVKLDEIAADYDLSPGDMRRLLTDLRARGELKISFDPKTGEIILPYITIGSTVQTIPNGIIYCTFCGLQLSKDAYYCPGCGANLH